MGSCSQFVAAHLGREFVEPAPWILEDVFPDTSARTPTIFILSPGQWGSGSAGCRQGGAAGALAGARPVACRVGRART